MRNGEVKSFSPPTVHFFCSTFFPHLSALPSLTSVVLFHILGFSLPLPPSCHTPSSLPYIPPLLLILRSLSLFLLLLSHATFSPFLLTHPGSSHPSLSLWRFFFLPSPPHHLHLHPPLLLPSVTWDQIKELLPGVTGIESDMLECDSSRGSENKRRRKRRRREIESKYFCLTSVKCFTLNVSLLFLALFSCCFLIDLIIFGMYFQTCSHISGFFFPISSVLYRKKSLKSNCWIFIGLFQAEPWYILD